MASRRGPHAVPGLHTQFEASTDRQKSKLAVALHAHWPHATSFDFLCSSPLKSLTAGDRLDPAGPGIRRPCGGRRSKIGLESFCLIHDMVRPSGSVVSEKFGLSRFCRGRSTTPLGPTQPRPAPTDSPCQVRVGHLEHLSGARAATPSRRRPRKAQRRQPQSVKSSRDTHAAHSALDSVGSGNLCALNSRFGVEPLSSGHHLRTASVLPKGRGSRKQTWCR